MSVPTQSTNGRKKDKPNHYTTLFFSLFLIYGMDMQGQKGVFFALAFPTVLSCVGSVMLFTEDRKMS